MNPIRLLTLAFLAVLCGCATHGPRMVPLTVHAGMSRNELMERCGSPLRIHRHADGREDWFYNFGVRQREKHRVTETTASASGHSVSLGHTTTTTTTMKSAPVHFSREGLVIGRIPSGEIVVE